MPYEAADLTGLMVGRATVAFWVKKGCCSFYREPYCAGKFATIKDNVGEFVGSLRGDASSIKCANTCSMACPSQDDLCYTDSHILGF